MCHPSSFSIGVVSKNVVDVCLEFSNHHRDVALWLIPSRRQVDYCGGYVEGWTTADLSMYVRQHFPRVLIQRDHGGPAQGQLEDDGFASLADDCRHLDSIHIDPWKYCKDLQQGIDWTIKMILFCHALNPNMTFEVGTEESIRPFTCEEFGMLLEQLQTRLKPYVYKKILFAVVQCGTGLRQGKNIGHFSEKKLEEMVRMVRSFGLIPKEHNGDWVDLETIHHKQTLGLTHINIAPEFGMIETRTIWEEISKEDRDFFFQLCMASGRWKKWVDDKFDPDQNKEELVMICGHYVFSNEQFKTMLAKYPELHVKIRHHLRQKLCQLFEKE